jgi:hypothetical protein
MNTVHIDTRGKVNQSFLDDMHREAKERQMLRLANQEQDWEKKRGQQRENIFLVIKGLFAWPAAHLHHRVSHAHSTHPMK